jgi:hypothetical protein
MNVNVWIERVRMEKHGSMYRAPVREPTLKTAESQQTVRSAVQQPHAVRPKRTHAKRTSA